MLFRSILLLLLLGTSYSAIDYITAFRNLQNADNPSLVWPTPNSNAANFSSTFGPRKKVSCQGCYDFHRGIDIHGEIGDDVVAIYDGHVERKATYADGGLTLVIEHPPFHDDVILFGGMTLFGGITTTRWYTLYMHLNSTAVEEGAGVTAGQIIGAVGMTGSTTSPHLHSEVRIGTRCSLEWSLQNPNTNPDSSCSAQAYDPHVHPFLVYPNMPATNVITSITQELNESHDAIVHIQTSDTNPNLNKYNVHVITTNLFVRKSHLLDLNLREGFDATSTAALDTQDKTVPYLEPFSFGYSAETWEMDLIIPTSWATLNTDERIVVTLTDIWGVDLPEIVIQGAPVNPTLAPSPAPTLRPTKLPTPAPTFLPTPRSTPLPTHLPTPAQTPAPIQCGAKGKTFFLLIVQHHSPDTVYNALTATPALASTPCLFF